MITKEKYGAVLTSWRDNIVALLRYVNIIICWFSFFLGIPLNTCLPSVLLCIKTSESLSFSDIFKRYEKRTLVNWLNVLCDLVSSDVLFLSV